MKRTGRGVTALALVAAAFAAGCDPAYNVYVEVNLPQTSAVTVKETGKGDRETLFRVLGEVAEKHGLEKSRENPGDAWYLFKKEYDHEVWHFHMQVEELEGRGRWLVMVTDFLRTTQSDRSKRLVTELIQRLEKEFGRGAVTLRHGDELP